MRHLTVVSVALLAACGGAHHTEEPGQFREIGELIESVRRASYPQLRNAKITVYDLQSDFDYFQTRFTVASYFTRKLDYMMMFNREAIRRQAPAEGLRAIVAHELAHIDYFESQSRMGLLGLIRLLSHSYTTRFERSADLEAIALGYGKGLEVYRIWLYRNVPSGRVMEKKRDYYSPEEIEAILSAEAVHPEIMRTFARCVPRNMAEIRMEIRMPAGACGD